LLIHSIPLFIRREGRWEKEGSSTPLGYDFWYQPYFNVMVSTEWGFPRAFKSGFNPGHVSDGNFQPNL
jgi:selenium-binding protein 1